MPDNTVKGLICGGLGYCCMWFFFSKYKRTSMIALRLGVTPRSVRTYKAQYKAGELQCENAGRCMKRLLQKGRSNSRDSDSDLGSPKLLNPFDAE